MRNSMTFYKVAIVFFIGCLAFSTSAGVEWVEQKNKAAEWMALSEQVVKTKLGRELRFSERIGLRLAQRQVRRHIQKMNRQANECTRIVLKDGSIIEASWFEMSNHIMEYKDCKTETDVIRTVRMNDVLSIVDVSGNVIYRDGRYLEPEEIKPARTPWEGLFSIVSGVASVVFFLVGPYFKIAIALSVLGLILAIFGIATATKSDDMWISVLGLVFNSLALIFYFIAISLIAVFTSIFFFPFVW